VAGNRRRRPPTSVACPAFWMKLRKALGGGVERLEEERIDGGVTRGKLRRVEIPALVVRVHERVADMVDMQAPGAVHDVSVLPRPARV